MKKILSVLLLLTLMPLYAEETVLEPGVTLTKITRGAPSKDDYWTLQVLMLGSRKEAEQLVKKLAESGYTAELREERNPEYRDLPAGTLGYGVRLGRYETREAAAADAASLSKNGFKASPFFTGMYGNSAAGPWSIRVLTIDPRVFKGEISATHGAAVTGRTQLSTLAKEAGALAAVNGGYYVMIPPDGIPGDPAGLFVDRGKVLSEATNGRITMNLFNRNKRTDKTFVRFERIATALRIVIEGGKSRPIDGINRIPGKIRNCGGVGDAPTDKPKHDFTCTDNDELIAITPEFGAPAPSGDGLEAVIDQAGAVTELRNRTGGAVPAGGMLIQGTGSEADWLKSNVQIGGRVRLETKITDARGKPVRFDSNDSAVNAGPGLVKDGKIDIHPVADGIVHSDDPSFFLRWGVRRNPRTMAGVDRKGRILLVTVDGHQPIHSVGMTLIEGARLMLELGAVNAMNLDGGGSTTMYVKGEVITSPSDPAGERPVGDAIVITSYQLSAVSRQHQ